MFLRSKKKISYFSGLGVEKLRDALQGRRVAIFLLFFLQVSYIFSLKILQQVFKQSLTSLEEVTDKHFMKSLSSP